jgi:hypothetical protein
MAAGATYEAIATQTLTGSAASITFNSIPSTYTDLRLVCTYVTSASGNLRLRFNSDTGTNYSGTQLEGDTGNGVRTDYVNSGTFCYTVGNATSSSTIPFFLDANILSYAGSNYKTCLISSSNDENGSGSVERWVDLWRSTSAINTILLYPSGGNFEATTRATLYGIKAA